jgi:hypothetical protein
MTDRRFITTDDEIAVEEAMPFCVVVPDASDWDNDDPYIIGPFFTRQEAENWATRYDDAYVIRLATPELILQTRRIAEEAHAFHKPAN